MTRRKAAADWWERLGNLHKVLLVVISLGAAVASLRALSVWLVWDSCAKPRAEAMVEERLAPLGAKLDEIRESVDFNTYSQIRRSDGATWEQVEREWEQLKKARGRP